jgi:hypothetical protein
VLLLIQLVLATTATPLAVGVAAAAAEEAQAVRAIPLLRLDHGK